MTVTVETLEKLERRITLNLSATEIGQEVDTRLKRLSRTVKADGFRPGKVPMSVVAQRFRSVRSRQRQGGQGVF
jgi:trigger factor